MKRSTNGLKVRFFKVMIPTGCGCAGNFTATRRSDVGLSFGMQVPILLRPVQFDFDIEGYARKTSNGAKLTEGQLFDLQVLRNLLIANGRKSHRFTANCLIDLRRNWTLNQRVPGSSPGAPTKQEFLVSSSFASCRLRTNRVSCDVFVVDVARADCCSAFPLFLYLHPIRYSAQIRRYRSITCSS